MPAFESFSGTLQGRWKLAAKASLFIMKINLATCGLDCSEDSAASLDSED